MRNKLSWVIGIAAFILFMIIATYSAKYMELPLDSDLGVIITFLAGFLANKVYVFIKQVEQPYEDILTSNCWIIGLTLMTIITGLIYKAFEHTYSDLSTYLRYALHIGAIAGIVWICKQIYATKKAQYEVRLKQIFEIENNK
jgi:uncharacterized membrane protein